MNPAKWRSKDAGFFGDKTGMAKQDSFRLLLGQLSYEKILQKMADNE
jgi:hypothetical protein